MKRTGIMLVAGDPSGDANAADLVRALAVAVPAAQFQITGDVQPLTTPLAPDFFGAGGPKMAAAGVELEFDLTSHAVIGLGGLLKKLPLFRRLLRRLVRLAVERQPELIILVDYGGFNLRLARAIKNYVRARSGFFFNWQPKIVQFISPQVWASRPGRAEAMAPNYDLILSLFPFEKKWFASRVPRLPVEFVGNPIFDRYPVRAAPGIPDAKRGHLDTAPMQFFDSLAPRSGERVRERGSVHQMGAVSRCAHAKPSQPATVLLLPGSRRGELKRHVPVMREAAAMIAASHQAQFKMVVPDETLAALARKLLGAHLDTAPGATPRLDPFGVPPSGGPGCLVPGSRVNAGLQSGAVSRCAPLLAAGQPKIELQVGGLAEALSSATIAITKTGTITLECAYFGLPAVAMYKTDWITYLGARRIATVKYLSMPNLLADQAIYPEFIQGQATARNIAGAALELLADPARRDAIRAKLSVIIQSLGGPGAARRAAAAIVKLMAKG
jgi:lipid-A-disaccharide synthase